MAVALRERDRHGTVAVLYLADSETAEIADGIARAEKAVDKLLNAIASRLGLDHNRVLKGVYAMPVMARFLADRNFKFADGRERDRLLYWYLQAAMWGRFAGSTETVLAQDLLAVTETSEVDPVERLVENLRAQRGDLEVRPGSFSSWSTGARFYPVLYALTRAEGARDWGTGDRLDQHALGKHTDLHLHHIFPKRLLYDYGYDKTEVNSLANLTFQTMETNLQISDHHPHDYLPEVLEKHPGAIESHRVPADPELWELERYLEFLELRRELLAAATNQLLDRLWNGVSELEPEVDGEEPIAVSIELGTAEPAPVVPEVDEEQALIAELQAWLEEQGFDAGELEHELVGSAGEPEAILDIAWPQGLQLELTERVALLLGEPESVSQAATSRGFRVFTEIEQFKGYAASLIDREATDEDAYGAALAASG